MGTASVIPFQIDFERNDLRTTQYKTTVTTTVNAVQTTETKKKEVPLIPAGASLHAILHCINEFYNAKKVLNWTTGAKLFENITDIFEDPQDQTFWETTLSTNASRSVNQFDVFIKEYINDKFSGDTKAYRNHKKFINDICKTKSLTVHQFVSLVQYHNSNILPLLPGAPADDASISSDDIKHIIFYSMPEKWRDDFDMNFEIDDTTLPVLVKYMEKRNNIEKRKGKQEQKKSGQKDNENKEGDGSNKKKGKGRKKEERRKNQQKNNRNSGRIQDSDPCPLPGHQGHTWGNCYQNARNPNANNGRNNNNYNNNNNRDNHINENNSNNNNGRSNGNNNGSRNEGSANNQSNSNPQQGDNYYCNFVEEGPSYADYTDLFHVDCKIDGDYFNEDLQRFPTGINETLHYEETFATENESPPTIEQESDSDHEELAQSKKDKHLSPAPPSNAKGYTRLSKPNENEDLAPTTVAVCNQINDAGVKAKYYFKMLFDSGSTDNILTKDALPKNVQLLELANPITMRTAQGTYSCKHYCYLKNVMFPELSLTRRCKAIKCLVIDSKMGYQLIIGRKYMKSICISMNFAQSTVDWYGKVMSFHPRNYFSNNGILRKVLSNEPYSVAEAYATQTSHNYEDASEKYGETDLKSLVDKQSHLDSAAKGVLIEILKKHAVLFAGLNNRKLGIFPNREYHIDLMLGAKPYHIKQPYSVPLHQQNAVKTELLRQLKLGILERCYSTEWGMPMFIIPKPDGSCRLIADFRELNKATKQLHYPLPKIQDIFHRRRNFKYVTLLDVSMQFHTFLLDKSSQNKCIIVTPFGKFKYLRLPMGFLNSPSWAQAAMDELFSDLTDVEVYIDDVGIFSKDFESHKRVCNTVLTKLQQNNFTVKPAKCHWFQSQAPWLGHVITPSGILPNPEKIKPILQLAFPRTITELRSFIGMVNFYRAFWKRRADIMAPLTALSGRAKGKLTQTPELLAAFNKVKAAISENVLLVFPNPNIAYDIYTDASDYQLGAVITQNNRTVAFFSRKLSTAQLKYPTIDKEMLCIVEVLKEYRSILWGARINVYTDHINLTRNTITSNRIMTWRMLCEEFSPVFHYIKGADNVIADALSRLPLQNETVPHKEEKGSPTHVGDINHTDIADTSVDDNSKPNVSVNLAVEDLYINYPSDLPNFPIAFPLLETAQKNDPELQAIKHYETKQFYGHDLKVYTKNGNTKIVLPKDLVSPTIKWYHHTQGHSGAERLLRSISQFLYSPGLKEAVRSFVKTCDECQRYKNPGIGIGHLPPRDETAVPFEQIAIDTMGPWNIIIPGYGKVTINAYSIIDTCTNLCELKRATQMNPTGLESVRVLEDTWLSRYPKPVRIIYDQGTEYRNIDFESYLISQGITGRPCTVKNPQSNAILERVHDVIKTSLRTQGHSNPPSNIEEANIIVDSLLASAQYAIRVCIHKTYGVSPGSIVFHRDMLLPLPIIVDLQQLRHKRQVLIDANNLRENKRRRHHDYTVGDQMMILAYKPSLSALESRARGPYTITQVHNNGTVSYLLNQHVVDRINIRRIKPYYQA